MENEKKKVTAGKFISELIFGYIFYTILFGLILGIPLVIIKSMISSEWIKFIFDVVSGAIVTVFIWKFSASSVIKKKTTERENISKIIKGLWIYVIIALIIVTAWDVFKITNTISQTEQQIEQYKTLYTSDVLETKINEMYQVLIPKAYITLIISRLVDAIVRVAMIRYTRYVLEENLK